MREINMLLIVVAPRDGEMGCAGFIVRNLLHIWSLHASSGLLLIWRAVKFDRMCVVFCKIAKKGRIL